MLEHLDGHDAIVLARLGGLECDHVSSDDLQVLNPALLGAGHDELFLCSRVAYAGDLRLGISLGHPQRERAPAAPELKDVLAVRQSGALAVQLQHRHLRLVEGHAGLVVQTTGVLEVAAEAQEVKLRGHLVVLFVCRPGLLRHGSRAQVRHEIELRLELVFGVVEMEQALSAEQVPDSRAKDEVRDEVHLDNLRCAATGIRASVGRGSIRRFEV